jgi:hypothetical protein
MLGGPVGFSPPPYMTSPPLYVSKSMTFPPTPHIGNSRHGLFFTRLDCHSNAKLSEKDHDLPGIRTRDPWSSSQHTQPLHHLGRPQMFHRKPKNLTISREQACSISIKTV